MAKERNAGWPGMFRAFAVLCAILLLLDRNWQGSGDSAALGLYAGLTTWSVPALFMLWGMEALEGGKPRCSAALLGLALPAFVLLVVWGAIYALAAYLLAGGGVTWAGVWQALRSAAWGNTHYHLWVLYPLIGLYLVHPVLHRFTASASRGEVLYFLGLCFLFSSLLPLWTAFHPNSAAAGALDRLDLHLVLGWVGCYVGGWYLRHYTISRTSEFLLYLFGILSLAVTLAGPRVFGGGQELWRQYTAPNVQLTAAALCALFRYVIGLSDERSRRSAAGALGEVAFGVYLLHPLWLLVLRRLGFTPWTALAPAVAPPLLALVLFLLSLPFAWLLGRIPVVGERLVDP